MRNARADALRHIAVWLALLSLVPFSFAQTPSPQGQNSNEPGPVAQVSQTDTIPDSPGAVRSQMAENDSQSAGQQATAGEQQAQAPVGTAAAGSVETTGVAASKPAGAAIAPAKQKRTRSLLIKVSALVGASVAIGTVVALSSASPSRPPGAR